MKRPITAVLTALSLTTLLLAPALPAQAAASAHKYQNCTAVHKVYSGGIAKPGVKYNKVGSSNRALKGTVKRSTALYNANRSMDRDHDGIACEKA